MDGPGISVGVVQFARQGANDFGSFYRQNLADEGGAKLRPTLGIQPSQVTQKIFRGETVVESAATTAAMPVTDMSPPWSILCFMGGVWPGSVRVAPGANGMGE